MYIDTNNTFLQTYEYFRKNIVQLSFIIIAGIFKIHE